MHWEIEGLSKNTFPDVVTLAHKTLGIAYNEDLKRAKAEQFVIDTYDNTRVLVVNGTVLGAYSYYELPNIYSLNFFALDPRARKKRAGYALYSDMKERLKGRPVNVTIYNDNNPMIDVVKKRGTFVGRTPSINGHVLDYYTIFFDDFQKKGKK